jgi:cell division septation protein DedD
MPLARRSRFPGSPLPWKGRCLPAHASLRPPAQSPTRRLPARLSESHDEQGPSAHEPRLAGFDGGAGRPPVSSRVPDGRARHRLGVADPVVRRELPHPAEAPEGVGPRLLDDLDARRLAAHRDQPAAAAAAAGAAADAGRPLHALPGPHSRSGTGRPPAARSDRRAPRPALPALRDEQLRNGCGARAGSRGHVGSGDAPDLRAPVLSPSRLHRGARGQRVGVPRARVRPSALQLPRHPGAPPAQERPDRQSLPRRARLLRGRSPAHACCYRARCFKTTELFVREAGIPEGKWSIAFQSRLGRDPC